MRKRKKFSLFLLFFLLGFIVIPEQITTAIHPVSQKPVQFLKGELLLKISSSQISALKAQFPFHIQDSIPELGVYRVEVPEGKEMEWLAQMAEMGIQVEPNTLYFPAVFPNDPDVSRQWYLGKIGVFDAWEIHRGSADIWVAVIDTGVDAFHPDLQGKIAPGGYDFIDRDGEPWEDPGNGIDEDRNGRADEWVGHGTGVSGVIAGATNNNRGIAGICWYCQILPIRVFPPDGSTTSFTIAQAVVYAAKISQVRVINLSLAGPEASETLREAIQFAMYNGKLTVAAAGNDASTAKTYPAAFPETLSVASTNESDEKAQHSNYGDWVNIAAPGVGIYSTSMEKVTGRHIYAIWSGTSFAAPVVSGVSAIIFSAHPDWLVSQVIDQLVANADPTPPPIDNIGRVNARKSLAAPDVSPPELLSVYPIGNTRIELLFSEPMKKDPLVSGDAFCSSSDITLFTPQLLDNGLQVVLFTSPQRGGQRYLFSCQRFQDLSGNETSFTTEFIGTDANFNFARNAMISAVPSGNTSALADGNLSTTYSASTPVTTITLKLPGITWLDTIILRNAFTEGKFEISTTIYEKDYSRIAEGFLTEQVVVHSPPFPARYVQLNFYDYPVPFQVAEIELYRLDMVPPELVSPIQVEWNNSALHFQWEVNEPSTAALFIRDKATGSAWSEFRFGALQYSFQSSFSPVFEGHVYEYYLRLTDGWGNSIMIPDVDNGQAPFLFFIQPNLSVQHSSYICLVRQRSVKFSFQFSPSPESVLFYYRSQGASEFSNLPMSFSSGKWEVNLAGAFITGNQLEYYVKVFFGGQNEFRIPSIGHLAVPIVPAGDINLDSRITEEDLLEIGRHFGETPDGILLPFSLDFDGNKIVDELDWDGAFQVLED